MELPAEQVQSGDRPVPARGPVAQAVAAAHPSRASDEETGVALVVAAAAGDATAVSTLWAQHRRWIAGVLLAHKPRLEDLEDLLQEVAMTFVASIHTLREPRHLRAWLRTVAVNAARAAGRARRTTPHLIDHEHTVQATERPGGTARLVDDEELRDVMHRLSLLPETYREPLLLRAAHGLRSRQIARILDVPPATVDTRIARARRMLRDAALERGRGGEPDADHAQENAGTECDDRTCERGMP